MQEVYDVTNEIRNASSSDIDIVIGTGFNVDLQGELIVTVIATGFDRSVQQVQDEENIEQADDNGVIKNSIQDTIMSTPSQPIDTEVQSGQRRKRETGEAIPEWLKNRFK